MPCDGAEVKGVARAMFSGSIPALLTPFRDGRVDEAMFRRLVDWQIDEGSSGLVPCGTTVESATMSIEERAKAAGASAALVVLPYYNRPNQDGLVAHFTYLTERCDLPILIYNVPGRTVTDIAIDTMAALAKLPGIVGVKDASGKVERVAAQRLACGTGFCQLSGNDDMALGFMAMGGKGCISVTANVAPRLCADFQAACAGGDWAGALALQDRLFPLHAALFSDASPGPVKYALARIEPGYSAELRLPMTPPSAASRAAVDAALAHAGLT